MTRFDFLFVTSGVPIHQSGGCKVLYALCNELSKSGYRVGMFFRRGTESIRDLWLGRAEPKTKVIRILLKINDSRIGYYTFNPLMRLAYRAMIFPPKFDIVLSKDVKKIFGTHLKNLEIDCLIATNFMEAKFIEHFSSGSVTKILFSQVDERIKEYSGSFSNEAIRLYSAVLPMIVINSKTFNSIQPGMRSLMQVGIDTSYFRVINPPELRADNRILIRLTKGIQKDPEMGIRALYMINSRLQGVKISAYGNMDREDVPEFVDFHKSPTSDELKELYNSAAIFIYPSLFEGMPLSPLEAMACGCAVVSTTNGGSEEYIKDSVNGILVPAADAEIMADKVIQIVGNRTLRVEIAQKAALDAMKFGYVNMMHSFLKAISVLKYSSKVIQRSDL